MTTSSRLSPEEPGIRRTLPAARPSSRGRSTTDQPVGGAPRLRACGSAGEVEHDNEAPDTAGHRERDAREPGHGNAAIATQAVTCFHTRGMPAAVQGYTFHCPKAKRQMHTSS